MFSKRRSTPEPTAAEAAAFPTIGSTLPSYSAGQTSITNAVVARPAAAADKVAAGRGQRNWRKIIKRSILCLIIIVLLAGGYVGVKFLMNTGKALNGNLFGLLQSTKLKGEDSGRVNILLAGNSADDPGHGGADLTDSIMIVSVDTVHHTAFMLSVPRDLWVELPTGEGYQKINAVYKYGEADDFSESGYAAGGMGALEKVISQNFGITINYYGLINYAAFRDAVNAVGGIDVTIASDDPRGLYDAMISPADGGPLRLANGLQHLDGQTALNLARARGSGYSYGFPRSDFDRTEHQRQMLVALKDKVISAGVLANPVKLGSLFDSFGDNVKTDFQTNEVRRLYDIGKDIPSGSITSAGLNDANGVNLLASYNANGQSALIPAAGIDDYSAVQAYIKQLVAPPASTNPKT